MRKARGALGMRCEENRREEGEEISKENRREEGEEIKSVATSGRHGYYNEKLRRPSYILMSPVLL